MPDPTQSTPVAVEQEAPPVVETPPVVEAKADPFKGPSFDDLKARHPESADDLTRLDTSHREMHKRAMEEAEREKAELRARATSPQEAQIAYLRRMADGDPYEGIEAPSLEAPDFLGLAKAKAAEKGEALLTSPDAIAELVAELTSTAYSKGREHAVAEKAARDKALAKKMLEPIEAEHNERARIQAVEAAVKDLQRLPGMKDQKAFDAVYDAMEAKGLTGTAGFRQVYTEMLVEHPEWTAPPAPVASATPDPVVVTRPAPKQPTPQETAAQYSAAFRPTSRPAARSVLPTTRSQSSPDQVAVLMNDPSVQAEIAAGVANGRANWEVANDVMRRHGVLRPRA